MLNVSCQVVWFDMIECVGGGGKPSRRREKRLFYIQQDALTESHIFALKAI
jgi:hypothetical protein